jgi:hypothetical protein
MLNFAIEVLFFAFAASASDITFERPRADFIITNSNSIVLREYNANNKPAFRFSNPNAVSGCSLDGSPCDPAQPITLTLPLGTRRPRIFRLEYVLAGKPNQISIQVLPDNFPKYQITGEAKLRQPIALSPNGQILLLDAAGEIQFYRHYSFNIDNFRPHLGDGKLAYSFVRITEAHPGVTSQGFINLLDQYFEPILELPWKADIHEFLWLGKDHYLFLAHDEMKLPMSPCFINEVVREYKNGKLIFEITGLDLIKSGIFYSYLEIHPFDGKVCKELYHVNSVQNQPNQRLLINLGRDGIILFNKSSRKTDWIFAGPSDQFNLSNSAKPDFVHTASFNAKSSTLPLFVNYWIDRSHTNSSIVEYQLDVPGRKVKKTNDQSPLVFHSIAMGSQEKSEDIFSVGLGDRAKGEVDFFESRNKKITFSMQFLDHEPTNVSYRAYRVPPVR